VAVRAPRSPPYTVAAFAIDARGGRLAYAGSGPLADDMAYIATDRTGRFLLSASYFGNKVTVNPIRPDGVVGPVQQTILTRPHAHCILTDPSNRHALHTSLGGDAVYQERFDPQTGVLSPNQPPFVTVRAKSGPRHLAFSPDGSWVYLLDELDGAIHVFPHDAASGTLQHEVQIAGALPGGFSGKPWAADVHLTPDGRFLYASERTSSTLAAFRVDPRDGRLTAIGTYPTAEQPRSFAIDPTGRFLIAAGELADGVAVHAIDPANGTLATVARVATGETPNWVEIISER
jgi:6-phosphogluconolactonase